MGNKFGFFFVHLHFYFYQVPIDKLHHRRPVFFVFFCLSLIKYLILRKQCTISVEENY